MSIIWGIVYKNLFEREGDGLFRYTGKDGVLFQPILRCHQDMVDYLHTLLKTDPKNAMYVELGKIGQEERRIFDSIVPNVSFK